MTQDEKELSEIARSIASLFGDEELETAATVQSGEATERHPDVGVSRGLEEALDADTEPDPPPAPDLSSEPALVDAVASPVESASIEVEETPIEADSTLIETRNALSEATSQYLEAPIHEREGAQRVLRSAVEASRSAGAFGEVASKVMALILQGVGDSDIWDLANEFIDEEVLAGMVAQLGRVRDEEEREALIQAYVRLGDPVAKVIADALTDTEDRSARKTYVAALAAFGTAGAQAVEKMLEDSRWFVVRNGVAVLGVVGGPSAIEHLMSSLANEHAGVRLETVRSLAKIGGENAESLVSSMLGDSDSKVRAAAARAVSAHKTERAYKQLIQILKKGDEEAVLEQVLRALGALGDASAVPAIEKRMKGSIFSRSPNGVRIAGLTALAAIGTPHAVSVVKKARTDKDPEISSAAAQLLSGK